MEAEWVITPPQQPKPLARGPRACKRCQGWGVVEGFQVDVIQFRDYGPAHETGGVVGIDCPDCFGKGWQPWTA